MSGRRRHIVWFGHLTTRARLRTAGAWFAAPGLLWLAVFLVLPLLALVAVSFARSGEYTAIEWTFTWENFSRAAGYTLLGWQPNTLLVLLRSVIVAAVTTAATVTLSFPLAFYLANKPPRSRYLWLALLIVPFCTNLVVRVYAWMLLLSSQLPPARLAQWIGWVPEGGALYPGSVAVYLGMISTFLPFTALPLYASVERLDWSLVEAATDLYASPVRVFRQAILPQVMPGLTVAVVLTLVPAMGMFLVPQWLGGSSQMLVGNMIQQQFSESRDYPFGAALSLALMALTLLGLWLSWRRHSQGGLP